MISSMADTSSETAPPVLLRAPPPKGEAVLEGDFALNIKNEPVTFHVEVPAGPVTLEALLPIFQGLASEVARRAAGKAIAAGEAISCRAGCGACCRQAVPVSEAEAHMIAALVEAMPEPRRSEIKARFEAAERKLEETTLASRVLDMADSSTVRSEERRVGKECLE